MGRRSKRDVLGYFEEGSPDFASVPQKDRPEGAILGEEFRAEPLPATPRRALTSEPSSTDAPEMTRGADRRPEQKGGRSRVSKGADEDQVRSLEQLSSLPAVERTVLFERLLTGLPEDFAGRAAALAEVADAFRREIADRLTPTLNAHLGGATPEDSTEKKKLDAEVMEKLDALGLAIRCPITGEPSSLTGQQDSKNPKGRHSIVPKGRNRPSISRTNLADLLPLELVADRARREALNEWRRKQADEADLPRPADAKT